MDDTNSAYRAPRENFARKPTGFRRLTPELLKADRTASGFSGYAEEGASHGRLLATFKAAVPRLGISVRLAHAIDWLFQFTQPQDWDKGAPIVWPSAALQQEALGLSRTQVKAINRRLIDAGLITMKDSPNGKRYGHRDGRGRIVEAYGFDLSPIAARQAEFQRLAKEWQEEREAIARLRRRATIARNGITQIVDTVRDYTLLDDEWVRFVEDTRAIGMALRKARSIDDLEAGVGSLERRQSGGRERLEILLKTVDIDPRQPENRPHYTTTNESPYPNKDTVTASKERSRRIGEAGAQTSAVEAPARRDKGGVLTVVPDELVRLAPRLRQYLGTASPTWPDMVNAADWLRTDLDVSKSLWGEACQVMGRERAAVALAIVSTKSEEHFTRTAGGYFRGMVVKARNGELNLDRSIWALRRAGEPKSGQPRKTQ